MGGNAASTGLTQEFYLERRLESKGPTLWLGEGGMKAFMSPGLALPRGRTGEEQRTAAAFWPGHQGCGYRDRAVVRSGLNWGGGSGRAVFYAVISLGHKEGE